MVSKADITSWSLVLRRTLNPAATAPNSPCVTRVRLINTRFPGEGRDPRWRAIRLSGALAFA
jgi:hypothetical protein